MSAPESAAPARAPPAAAGSLPSAFTRRWQLLALAAGFAFFLSCLAASFYLATRAEHIRAEGRHSSDVLTTAQDLLNALLDCEAGQRGYLLTHDQRYLEPYLLARVNFKSISTNLASLTHADRDAAARVAEISPLIDAKILEMEQTVVLEQNDQHTRALAIVKGDAGLHLMMRLRDGLGAVSDLEQVRLDRARAQIDRTSALLRAVIVLSIVVGFILLMVVGRARSRLLRDLALQNATLEERVRERTAALETRSKRIETLMQDMSHRIGNSLSLVTGFLDLQARASKSVEVKSALAAARQRVFSIASAQRRLRLTVDSDSVEANGFFDALVDDFRNALPDHRITIATSIAPGALPSQDAIAYGVILNELIANAIKHAWGPNDEGQLDVRYAVEGGERVLTVTDDGRGHAREDTSGGLGQILIQSLVQSLRGSLSTERVRENADRPGLRCVVRAPV